MSSPLDSFRPEMGVPLVRRKKTIINPVRIQVCPLHRNCFIGEGVLHKGEPKS